MKRWLCATQQHEQPSGHRALPPSAAHPSRAGHCGLIPRGDLPLPPCLTGATTSSPFPEHSSPSSPRSVLRSCCRPRARCPRSPLPSAAWPPWAGGVQPTRMAGHPWWAAPGWTCAASSDSASVPAAAARSCCSTVKLCQCSVLGLGPAAITGLGQTILTLCPALPVPCPLPATAAAPCSCSANPPPSSACAQYCRGVLVTHRGLWACFGGL